METPSLCLHLLYGGHATVGQEWNFPEHLTECGKLYLITAGTGWVRHGGLCYQMQPHHLYLIPEAVPHSCGCSSTMAVDYVHFTGVDETGANVFRHLPVQYSVRITGDIPVAHLMDSLIDTGRSNRRVRDRLASSGMLQTLLSLFIVDEPRPDSELRSRMSPVLVYVDRHIGDRFSISSLAAQVGLDRRHFSRLFRRLYRMSPTTFIQQRRLSRVKFLLRATDASIGSIAEELGYTDGSHLWREFKHATGMAPSQYRVAEIPEGP